VETGVYDLLQRSSRPILCGEHAFGRGSIAATSHVLAQRGPLPAGLPKEILMFTSDTSAQLLISRNGVLLSTVQVPPRRIISISYDRLGPDGELTGDVVITIRPGPSDEKASPLVMALEAVEVTRQ
jgi:hypothetical protein